ncbi:MAG: Gfo/Idh/MocA family oxidoreductase [Fimbriimonas sp.]|nr:Gfo/Idh/MocA family oxidoreductase [Fimbriimonas sp.]
MDFENPKLPSRRTLLKAGGTVAAGSLLPTLGFGNVHMSNDETIQVALVGCGGRGGGAAANAMSVPGQNLKLVAVADVFQDRMDDCLRNLNNGYKAKMDLPKDRQFLGFDAYKQAMDCLKPGDIVILTTPPAFRWVHFQYAISKKLNIFMEKPVSTDGPSARKMLALSDEADKAGLKIGVGLMSRHSVALQQLHEKVTNGDLGEILLLRGYRMHGPAASFESTPKPDGMSHLEYQIRRFHSFLWASGGCFSDFYIHHIDHLSWMKNSWPVTAQGLGGRHYRENAEGLPLIDQNFDSYSVEYTFEDGTKFIFDGRCVEGAHGIFSSYVHGTKGSAIAARSGDCNGPSATFANQTMTGTPTWISTDRSNPYQNEWNTLVKNIRNNTAYNEVKRGVNASLVTAMGRMAAHTAQVVTLDQMLNCAHEFAPGVDKLNYQSDSPLMPGKNGKYPVPQPGKLTDREF